MKTKLLVPGTSLMLLDEDEREKSISYVATEWLVSHPHAILWSDEICMSDSDFKTVHACSDDQIVSDSIRLLFDKLKRNDVIKTFNPSSIAPPVLKEAIERQVAEDEERWKVEKPTNFETGKIDMAYIRIGDLDICPFRLQSVYTSLAFANLLDAHCLFNPYEYEICKKRFAEISRDTSLQKHPFQEVLEIFAPDFQLLGDYVIKKEQCNKCKNEEKCASRCIEQTEEAISMVLDLRERDEIVQLKQVISDIIEKLREKENHHTSEEERLKMEIQEKVKKCKHRLFNTFPKVERWAHITTVMSIPISFAGTSSGNSLVSFLGLGLLGLSQITTETIKYLQSKYKWIAFLDKVAHLNPKKE